MALLPDIFIPEEASEDPFAPIPADWYVAEITKSELKDTKDRTGKYLAMTFVIAEGQYKGRFMFANLNLVNKSDIAVQIARADLKNICTAVGHEGELEDSEDLHNILMEIKISIKPESAQWPAKNEIKGYRAEGSGDNPLED